MMSKRTIIAASVILGVGICMAPGIASAANGGAWLLGRSNSESAATTVTNSGGTPLSLNAKSGYAPLAVNSTKVVTRLNADLLDGLHASSFLRSTGKAADANKLDGLDSTAFAMRSAKAGTIVHDGSADFLGAACPAGTVFGGGGGFAKNGAAILYSGPDWNADTGAIIPNSWLIFDDSINPGVSYVTCTSPSGAAIPGAATTVDQLNGNTPAAISSGRALNGRKVAQAKAMLGLTGK